MIAVSYHDTVNVLQRADLASSGPFTRADWFALLAAHAPNPPLIAIARNDDSIMAWPLVHANGRIEPLLNWYSFSWQPLVSTIENLFQAELMASLARTLRERSARLTLWPLPDENGLASAMERAFRSAGWIVARRVSDSNHWLETGGRRFKAYLRGRPGALRAALDRKGKHLETEIFDYFDVDTWDIYEHIYANSWKPAEGNATLLRQFAEAEGAAGRIRLGITRHQGRPVAAQFWTVEAGTAWIHKLAHDERARHLSPGTVLTAAMLEHAMDRDEVGLVDFGTGDDSYKRDWMEAVRPRYLLDCHNPSRPASWPHIARAAVQRLVTGPKPV